MRLYARPPGTTLENLHTARRVTPSQANIWSSNLAKHGIDFQAAEEFEWDTALIEADVRQSYGEVRLVAYGRINGRLHALVYTIRRTSTWIISLRRANNKEVRHYEGEG